MGLDAREQRQAALRASLVELYQVEQQAIDQAWSLLDELQRSALNKPEASPLAAGQ